MLGQDGVLRSFSGDRSVYDAAALSPSQIQEWWQKFPSVNDSTWVKFRRVDGTRVDKREWFEPSDEKLRPLERTPEERLRRKKEFREMLEKEEKEEREGKEGKEGKRED
jgi:hypothetical protein